jgi:hypothetical protein
MSVYKNVSNLIGLDSNSQGQDGLLYLMLSALDVLEEASPTGDSVVNPFDELINVRLANWKGGHAHQWLASKIGTRVQPKLFPWIQH